MVVRIRMMYNSPFSGFPFYRRYPPPPFYSQRPYSVNTPYHNQPSNTKNTNEKETKTASSKECKKECEKEEGECFEIFGIKLYSDDLLLICLLFFLYREGVEDQTLFISLILLLLS